MGWLFGMWAGAAARGVIIENVLVGVFGAFIGGDFVVAMLTKGVVDESVFQFRSLLFAVVGAVVFLSALRLMRGSVGAIRVSKSRNRDH